ncbi:MAG TPA: peptide ABC transporter substrate-binding protein, partial [Caulobacteraceae bacterium]|nr:peptide ABC transporter substrate-binding protein [Caulobacteraceae bacterium]
MTPMRPRLSLLIAAAGLAVLALFTAGCHQKGPQRAYCPAGEKCLEYGNTSEPNSLDPQIITSVTEFAIVGELMQGLMMDGPSGEPVPGLAYRWETSPDGLIWTFHIRPAKWSDGKPVTADDFVYAYRRILDPKTASPYAYMLYLLKNGEKLSSGDPSVRPQDIGVRALDAHTLELTLDHPAPYLPQILRHSTYYPVPAHVVAKWGAKWVQPAHYVGDGPYKLVDWRLGDYVRIDKNPNFWQAEKVCFDRITFYPSPDVVTAERRVKRGELDINNTIQSSRVAFLRQPDQMPRYVRTHPYLSTSYVIFN